MARSFLYKVPESETITPENTVYNLSLDRTMDIACSDVKAARYFIEVAKKPLTKEENIVYRREILFDFLNNNDFYYEFRDVLGKIYDEGKINEKERKYRFSLLRHNDSEVSYQSTKQALTMTAYSLSRILTLIVELCELLDKKELSSEGFLSLRARLRELCGKDAYRTLIDIASYFSKLPNIDSATARLTLDADGFISRSCLVSCNEVLKYTQNNSDDGSNKNGKLSLFRKKKSDENDGQSLVYSKMKGLSPVLGSSLLDGALSEPTRMMDRIITALYDELAGIRDEILFYKAGLKLIAFFKEKKIDYVFPKLTDKPVFRTKGLKDTFLLSLFPSQDSVISNDAELDENVGGILIFGGNNTGKTVYIRSVGTAQLFAQAGFPVTAKEATIGIRNGIFTQFASGEKEFEEGNEAGRFEQEVREIASLVKSSDRNSLVLFNETFQTTAYSEGADGLYHILRYLSAVNTHWILVSHLTRLDGRFKDKVTTLHTSSGFRMI